MIKRLIITVIIFGFASLAGLSICIRSPFAVDNTVIDENDRVVLHGNIHPKARPEFDVGPTDPSLPMKRIILLLKIAPEKQAKLDRLVSEQTDPSSPNFHRWLTPEDFGKRFGRSQEKIDTVKGWLISHGFSIDETAKGGTWINFSGTAAEVDLAFHTNMHDYNVDGRLHHANSTDPSIPRALTDLVAGPVSLHNFPRKAMHTPPRQMPEAELQPGFTESNGTHDLAPGDFAAIYDVNNVYNLGYDGADVTIAIVGRTHPAGAIAKWNIFRSTFGLPSNPPVITVNGPDPGDLGSDEDSEADLDVEWSGAVATGATINFVTSKSTDSADGVDLSAQYIVDNNRATIISDCFGTCEAQNTGATGNAFYNSLWEQAASYGITVFVVTGDSGAYACTNADGVPTGLGVNGLASTPFNIAVGGTQLSDASNYWNPGNSANGTSALGYVPEVAWNNYNAQNDWVFWASGGGASSLYGKPAWQVCPGVPNDGLRDMPDVSLNADTNVGYRVYTCTNATGPCNSNSWVIIGGTSGATPSFAGIMALIVQSAGGQRQGNFNNVLYQLGNAQYSGVSGASPVFNDITSGNNGFIGNGVDLPGYSCTPYYDLVTCLGSVNVTNLLLAMGTFKPPAIEAIFGANKTSGKEPLTVHFSSSSIGRITKWLWNFGDGHGSKLRSPSHTYNRAGAYSVTLTVIGAGGTNTLTRSDYITVYAPPKANFSAVPRSGDAPLQVDFVNESTGVITSWLWRFGDGTTSTAESPNHTYNSPRTYTAKLTVSGPGGSRSKTMSIGVKK